MPVTHAFHFYGPVTTASFQNLKHQIMTAVFEHPRKAEVIKLFISSEGGELHIGFAAFNFLRSLPVKVSAINMGNVESAAVMIYLGAEERYSLKYSRFLLHDFNWTFAGNRADAIRISEHSLSLDFDKRRYADIFKDRTQPGQSEIDIVQCLNGIPRVIDPATATAAGICRGVLETEDLITTSDIQWWCATV